jgi:CubicO group peptidase (beta-lactamase class C family)
MLTTLFARCRLVVLFAATTSACGSGGAESTNVDAAETVDANPCAADIAALEQALASALDAAAVNTSLTTDPNLTLLLETIDGRRFTHSHGTSTPTSSYESASTSKLVTAVMILDLVEQGELSLDTKPGDLISFWTAEDTVTLRHLLSFRSGFHDEAGCLNLMNVDFENCVSRIYSNSVTAGIAPAGSQFFYSSSHLQIAGLMAMKATGTNWSEIFAAWQAKSGLFPTGAYDLPSATNPRLAGGMHWTGEEYLAFLRALYHGTVLTEELRSDLFGNQRGSATVASSASPILMAVNEDWSYGFGNWLECPTATGPNSFDCGEGHRNSSPGAYGAYPMIDFDHDYIGVLARRGDFATFAEGLAVFRAVEDGVNAWADFRCEQ